MSTFEHSKNKKQVSHDTVPPPNLISFMLKSWKPKPLKRVLPLKNIEYFSRRREVLSGKFPGDWLIIPTGHLKVRANDQHYKFRANSDFFYLTGNLEPDCVLILMPEAKGHRSILFVEPNPGKTDSSFFTDRVKGELWEGARLGIPESRDLYRIPDCRSLTVLESFISENLKKSKKTVRILRGNSEKLEKWICLEGPEQVEKDKILAATLSEMRLIKDKAELKELAMVIEATKRGFEDVIARLKTAKTERELEGVFFTRARIEGNDVGYASIVASGAHACTLHWNKNTGKIEKGDLLLLDAGIEGHSLYTADITRTLPISGKFTKEQLEIYDIVLAAQKAGLKEVKPGNDFMAPNTAAMKVLAEGLERLKILPTTAEEALKDENQFYKRYSLHNVSHMLGIDVHDCAQARAENYKYGKLLPGMVLTVEPGLYFQTDDLTVPAKYRGIGIRIEDDIVVTEKGHKNLSQGIPTEAKEIEKWMQKLWKSGKKK
ncbi:MAG: aminopeptidase P family protein [Proteobacteria bacterium]|nr:aminopeptidase P family protein [Pseudomonadota bacterium]